MLDIFKKTERTSEKLIKAPSIRFLGFEGDWKPFQLGEVCEKIQDGNYGADYPKSSEFIASGIPFLTSKAIGEDGTLKVEKVDYISESKHCTLKKAQLKMADVLFTNRGSNVGVIGYVDERIAHGNIGPQLTLLRSNCNIILPKLLYFIMQSESVRRQIKANDSGSAMNFFGILSTSKFKINIPSLPEQQKIASFLSAVDEKIQQLTRKKELLEQYKKGVMQQIFSRKIRFKDENGKDYPEWEKFNYSDVYSFFSTNSLSREKLNYEQGEIKNVHYGDIHTKFNSLLNVATERIPFVNSDVDLSKLRNKQICLEGDIIIADASEDYTDIGKAVEVVNTNSEKLVAGLHTLHARPTKNKLYVGFGGYLMQSDVIRMQIKRIAQGTKVLSISATRLGQIQLELPSLKEQKAIVNILSSLDTKVLTIEEQIKYSKDFKKGLLQQMFV